MNGAALLQAIVTPSDRLEVEQGCLRIAGEDAASLLARYGSPLYVAVQETIQVNYRRIRDAFTARWPAPVTVMYAIKSNNTLAIRALLSREGAGGDCFGLGELHACLVGGTDPSRMVMNGSDKAAPEIAAAIAHDVLINIDGEDEVAMIEAAAPPGRRVRVNLRLKPLPPEIDRFSGAFFKSEDGMLEAVRRTKWGFSRDAAAAQMRRIQASPHLTLCGYSCHIGRFSSEPDAFAVVAAGLARDVVALSEQTGFWPSMLDIGGGWPRQREPESRAPGTNPHPIETYATVVCEALLAVFGPRPLPELWLEPGRYLVGNGVVLLARVGAVKRDLGHIWVHVDASTNNLMRIETSRAWHHILPASRMASELTESVDIVGGTCIPSVLGTAREMPVLSRGDVLAILDAGMYSDAISNQFNSVGRPACVLLSPTGTSVVRRRETVADVFARDVIPPHDPLMPSATEQTFFADPAIDRVMSITLALAAELFVLRAQVRRLAGEPDETADAEAYVRHLLEASL